MITEDYVSFETAKLLKEKGFEVPSFKPEEWIFCMYDEEGKLHWGAYSDDWYCRVTLQMAMKWLREVHKLYIEIGMSIDLIGKPHFNYSIVNKDEKYFKEGCTSFEWEYEKACEAAIKYCLNNLI